MFNIASILLSSVASSGGLGLISRYFLDKKRRKRERKRNQPFHQMHTPLSQEILTQLQKTTPAYERALQGLPSPTFEETFKTAYEQPVMKHYRETMVPDIQRMYAGGGAYWGSERAQAEQKALTDVADVLMKTRATAIQQDIDRTLGQRSNLYNFALGLLGQTPYHLPEPSQQYDFSPILSTLFEHILKRRGGK